jgi:hypothetical protein
MPFAAEIYPVVPGPLGATINMPWFECQRIITVDRPAGTALSSSDVMIRRYNEATPLLKLTPQAAVMMHYPADLSRVQPLNDGGTNQKIADHAPATNAPAFTTVAIVRLR